MQVSGPMMELIDRKPAICDCQDAAAPKSIQWNIEFKDVCFAYPQKPDKLILNNFNLSIKQNQVVGILADSGSGKSTII